jgi:hypothetical protein
MIIDGAPCWFTLLRIAVLGAAFQLEEIFAMHTQQSTALLATLVCFVFAAPAQAQTRAFVSAVGSDSNNCINTNSPCRHFQAAYNALPAGGEIDVLDPANYGAR